LRSLLVGIATMTLTHFVRKHFHALGISTLFALTALIALINGHWQYTMLAIGGGLAVWLFESTDERSQPIRFWLSAVVCLLASAVMIWASFRA
jgi:hypothetical protein